MQQTEHYPHQQIKLPFHLRAYSNYPEFLTHPYSMTASHPSLLPYAHCFSPQLTAGQDGAPTHKPRHRSCRRRLPKRATGRNIKEKHNSYSHQCQTATQTSKDLVSRLFSPLHQGSQYCMGVLNSLLRKHPRWYRAWSC